MTRDGELAARDYVALVAAGAGKESDIGLLQSLCRQALRAVEVYVDPSWAPTGYRLLADKALEHLRAAAPGSDHQLAWAHAFIGAARDRDLVATVADIYTGAMVVDGLQLDDELRWAFVQALAARGAIGIDEIDAELERDPSAAGIRHAATARALQPTEAAKASAWHLAVNDDTRTNANQLAVIMGFPNQGYDGLMNPYVQRYFDEIEDVWQRRTSELAQNVVVGMFPSWASAVDKSTLELADEFLGRAGLPSALRRLVSEGRADVARALRAREADATAGG
jgi:aminopeptidase N